MTKDQGPRTKKRRRHFALAVGPWALCLGLFSTLRELRVSVVSRSRSTASSLLSLLIAAMAGCGGTAPNGADDVQGKTAGGVLVFAAASTADAMDEIKRRFEQESGARVRTSYAGSSTLAQQIVQGADADVFLTADAAWADFVEAESLAAQRRDLLANRLVVIACKDSMLDLRKPGDLATEGVKHLALADPQSVPAGKYARQALVKLGIWEAVKKKVVAAADVRQALAYVETGAAEAGIVYATDAAVSKSVQVVAEIPPQWTEPIRYCAVMLRHGAGNPAAELFYRHLFSPAAAEIFQKHGFVVLQDRTSGQ
jgi:molybdate transport system substrate-binding protein